MEKKEKQILLPAIRGSFKIFQIICATREKRIKKNLKSDLHSLRLASVYMTVELTNVLTVNYHDS